MAVKKFSDEQLEALRSLSVIETLELLGLHWKADRDYRAVKDKTTKRINVSVDERVFELLATGSKWYDTRATNGGGGAIDLTIYLFQIDFVSAVKMLTKCQMRKC